MKKSKRRRKPRDRLSELPDSLIFEIFWLLPMTDVVRTSILSKRWRNLCKTTPFLNFDSDAMEISDDYLLPDFVNQVVSCWNGERVLKFKFEMNWPPISDLFTDVDVWVGFAMRNGVEELYLDVHFDRSIFEEADNFDEKTDMYWLPQSLYAYSSFKLLKLKDCNFDISANRVEWNRLESLTIEGLKVTANVIDAILSGSSRLRVFNLRYAEGGENLIIESSTLKELSIDKYLVDDEDVSIESELRICTPNLEMLEILGIPYSKCLLTDVSSVTSATIGLYGLQHCELERGDDSSPGRDFQGNALSQILQSIQHVESVTLLDCCVEVLEVLEMECIHLSFANVKSLELICCFYDYEKVAEVLEIFPKLERLVLQDYEGKDYQGYEPLEFQPSLPESFLLQLRTIEVTWTKGDGVFPLIEVLLKYAGKLEKVVFKLKYFTPRVRSPPLPPSESLLLASEKLLRMRRLSPNCTIDFTKLRIWS